MYYEDVTLKSDENLLSIMLNYGLDSTALAEVLAYPKNKSLFERHKDNLFALTASDTVWIPIPWKFKVDSLNAIEMGTWGGAEIYASRDGQEGTRVHWLQTVYQSNQPASGTQIFCADGCPADDNLPYYYTEDEYLADSKQRKKFHDVPRRAVPSKKIGSTAWRAILSLGIVTEKRVTVLGPIVWGFDLTPAGKATKAGPRLATYTEASGHLQLLRNGVGKNSKGFGLDGWTFRRPPTA